MYNCIQNSIQNMEYFLESGAETGTLGFITLRLDTVAGDILYSVIISEL